MKTLTDQEWDQAMQDIRDGSARVVGFNNPNVKNDMLDPIEATWNTAYPERHLWKDIGPEAQAEWRRVFSIYDQIKSSSTQP